MTKVQLLKWLDGKQREALAEVKEQHRAAQEQLLAMKIEKSGYPELAASVLPLLQEVFDKLEAIHKDHEDLIGPSYYSYGELPHTLRFRRQAHGAGYPQHTDGQESGEPV